MTKKRILAIAMALALTAGLLAGCSSVPGMGGSSSSGDKSDQSNQSVPSNQSNQSSQSDPSDPSDQSQPDSSGDGSEQVFYIGDTISTVWFDFTVDSVEVLNEYEGYTAQEGKKLLVVQLSLKSTFTSSSDMFQEDFVAGWDLVDEDDFDYVEPLSAYCDAQFPDEYSLGINESRTGLLIYEVPADQKDFWINFMEYFADESYGDSYFVYFTAD